MEGLQGTETQNNLILAVIEKKKAVKYYTYLGQMARKQGYPLIQQHLDRTAAQEQIHANIYLEFLAEYSTPTVIAINDLVKEDLIKNLQTAANREADLHKVIYPAFTNLANAEGFKQIALAFKLIGKIDAEHSFQLAKIASELEDETIFKKADPITWHCQVCGYSHFGVLAPTVCEVCHCLKGYFQAGNIS